jgi:CHAD domain-containing protein
MSLEINDITRFPEGIKKVIRRECVSAIALLEQNKNANPHETVHKVRKSFKKIRALFRLVRDAMEDYHKENRFFRDEGRRVSDIRDATALIEALDLIYGQYSAKLYKNSFADIRQQLEKRRKSMAEKAFDEKDVLQAIRKKISAKCESVYTMPIEYSSFASIAPSLKRVYKRGRKAYRKAKDAKHPDDFHEWRKRVKYLRYQLRAIEAVWPDFMDTWEDELHKLSDYLGTDRDLMMLRNHILENSVLENSGENQGGESHYLLRTIVDGHRKQLQEHALLLGKRLYHMKPDHFASLVGSAMEAHIDEKNRNLVKPGQLEC